MTIFPNICPSSYYCPQSTVSPIVCSIGTFCPNGTAYPLPCPLGYIGRSETNNTLANLGSFSTACVACPAGYYGTDPQRLTCNLCSPGYVCLGATTSATPTNSSENGFICPSGSYCPAGSSYNTPCDAGTFQPAFGASNSSQCLDCAAGTYQFEKGMDACFICSSSSTSARRSTACTCIGKHPPAFCILFNESDRM